MHLLNTMEAQLISGAGPLFAHDNLIEEYLFVAAGFIAGASIPFYLAGGLTFATATNLTVLIAVSAAGACGAVTLAAIYSLGVYCDKMNNFAPAVNT